jgi:hypothetical protein
MEYLKMKNEECFNKFNRVEFTQDCERITLRGELRDRRPQRWLTARSRAENHPVRVVARGGPPLRAVRARQRGVRSGSRRGLAQSKDCANLCSGRPVRARGFLRKHAVRGSLARAFPERGRPKAKVVKGRHLSLPHTRNRCARGKCPCIARIAEVGRTSLRAQRSAQPSLRLGRKPGRSHGARERGLSHEQALRA